MKRTTAEIAMMTPQEAYAAGSADGREDLAESMRRDALAAAASESVEAKAKLDGRLDTLERAVKVIRDDGFDKAALLVKLERRVEALEGGKVQ